MLINILFVTFNKMIILIKKNRGILIFSYKGYKWGVKAEIT